MKEVANPAMRPLLKAKPSRRSRASAASDGVDAFLDLALEDNLRHGIHDGAVQRERGSRIPELITDSRVMVGLIDGGAHVDMLCDAGYCTYLLGPGSVRGRR